jgi:phenylalanine-4-hydroxylase
VFTNVIAHEGKPIYIQTTGPTALSNREKELVGHGIGTHPDGFGSPIGKLKGINLAIEDMSPRDLRAYDIYEAEKVTLEFEGNITVSGKIITGSRNLQGQIILISFENCTVKHNDTVLFAPEWGIYDMAVGKKIISAFSGPADVNSFDMITHVPNSKTIKAEKSEKRANLEKLYATVREIREGKSNELIETIFLQLKTNYPKDWLLCVEIVEILNTRNSDLQQQVIAHLEQLKTDRPEISKLITNGLELILNKTLV